MHLRTLRTGLPALMITLAVIAAAGCALKTTALGEGVWVASDDSPAPNSGIVRTPFGPVLIDGQPGSAAGAGLAEAASKVTGYKDVPYLVLTSHHADHTLGNEAFMRAEIIAASDARTALLEKSEAERKLLRERLGIAGTKYPELVPPTVTFEKAMTLYAGWPKDKVREIRLLVMPAGAAPGNLVVLLPKEKILFAGDLVTNEVFPYMGDADLAEWLKALDEIEKLDFDRVVPGHGAPGGRELVAATRKFLTGLAGAVAGAKASGRKLEEVRADFTFEPCRKWPGCKELLPIALDRLWGQKLPEGVEVLPAKPATPAEKPAQ
ncbi:MAG TPA: MBL fold metallo-hydrolase, partial [Planctomycetota bacterium]|nr:MBL fold metallo-hydrolase [Planctomycetota bacterium]